MSNKPVAKTPDVREALADLFTEIAGLQDMEGRLYCGVGREYTDKAMAIIQPLIEAAELSGIDTGTTAYESTCEALIQEVKKEERERIADELNKYWSLDVQEAITYIKIPCNEFNNILKGGE